MGLRIAYSCRDSISTRRMKGILFLSSLARLQVPPACFSSDDQKLIQLQFELLFPCALPKQAKLLGLFQLALPLFFIHSIQHFPLLLIEFCFQSILSITYRLYISLLFFLLFLVLLLILLFRFIFVVSTLLGLWFIHFSDLLSSSILLLMNFLELLLKSSRSL